MRFGARESRYEYNPEKIYERNCAMRQLLDVANGITTKSRRQRFFESVRRRLQRWAGITTPPSASQEIKSWQPQQKI